MAKRSDVIFRSSVGGYNKNDVNEYIEVSEIRHKKAIDEYEVKVQELNKKLEQANERIKIAESRDFSTEAAAYESQIAELNKSLDELNEKLAESEKIICAKTEEIAACENEITAKNNENAELSKKVAAISLKVTEAEDLLKKSIDSIDKAKKYDEISSRIGDIILVAETRAEAIVEDAQKESSKIIEQTEKKRLKTVELLNRYAESCRDKISEVTVASAKERLNCLNAQMLEFEQSISKALSSVKEHSCAFEINLDNIFSSIDSKFDSILDSENQEDQN